MKKFVLLLTLLSISSVSIASTGLIVPEIFKKPVPSLGIKVTIDMIQEEMDRGAQLAAVPCLERDFYKLEEVGKKLSKYFRQYKGADASEVRQAITNVYQKLSSYELKARFCQSQGQGE